ncbi:PxKF domain-containing protein [Knoellia koreensis]|uniref:Ig-like domain-containing protein n=1 Tax=Knoellia koreensis TaxID=2730921 RepID=A0A849HI20_9MICO|nr:hypothetical protein [Knoellia sp. DB2414S]
MTRTALRAPALAASCLLALFAGALPALADDIVNDITTQNEVMSLTAGGAPGSTVLSVTPTGGDGKNGCNLTGGTSATFAVTSSNPAVATVSPASVTFTSCSDTRSLTVTPVAEGTSSVTLRQTANSSQGSFNTAPAAFTANVAKAVPTNTAPSVSVIGVSEGATYTWGSVPAASCAVTDKEDGNSTSAAVLAHTAADYVGPQTATCSYTDGGGLTATSSVSFTIAKAPSTINLDCPAAVTYDGTAQTPCSARVTGVGGLDQALTVGYGDNTNAGTASASASYAGDATHAAAQPASATFAIGKAASTTTMTCRTGVVYTGGSQDICSANVTGVGGLDQAVGVSYNPDSTNAGNGTATATFAGDANHVGSSAEATFEIGKATSTIALSCSDDSVFDGTAQTPCTAEVSGVGGLQQSVPVSYENNVHAGTATATAAYAGDANHGSSDATATFPIAKAATTTTLTCPESVTYDGSSQQPCTATVTGPAGLDQAVSPTYTADTTNAGEVGVTADYAGSGDYLASSDSATFTIAKAPSTVSIDCAAATYTGSAQTPCSATVTGAGTFDSKATTLTYADNVNAGTASVTATYGGDRNHLGDTATGSFAIAKAPSSVAVTCPASVEFSGAAQTPCTARATGVGGLDVAVTDLAYANNTKAGTATVTATYAGDANHTGSTGTGSFTINPYRLGGFYQPVDMGGVLNSVKAGSTVPLKFELFSGSTEITSTSAVASFTATKITCATGATVDDVELTTTGGTSLRYDTSGGQFIQNWQTPKAAGSCYKVTMTAVDGSTLTAQFKLK